MAAHIDNIASSSIPKVTKTEFYEQIRWGDLLFCSGNGVVAKAVRDATHSPFSHVLFCWLPDHANQWLTIEAVLGRGVHVGKLTDYVDNYDGDLVLARRAEVGDTQKFSELNVGFELLEDSYDWKQEATTLAHKLLHFFPIAKPKGEYYCSGLMYAMSLASCFPLQNPGPELPTPEDNWTDPSVVPVCAMVRKEQ